jgi:16S rRNA (cytosine1402-N4)-methyltransferase
MTERGAAIAANGGSTGGPVRHRPVMLDEVLAILDPGSGSKIIDGTFGAGGYTRAIMEKGALVLAIDRDPDAIAQGQSMMESAAGRLNLVHGRFSELDILANANGFAACDGVVLDIGVSSMQLDEAERGFSFNKDGPLDMRMGQGGASAADVVNNAVRNDLIRIIGILGEEKQASRIASAIIAQRNEKPFTRTLELAGLVEKTLGRKQGERIHPATRTFQALRIFVNSELEELVLALEAAERVLREGGRLAVVTFHSLEDRIVKRFFADRSGAPARSRHLPPGEHRPPTFRLEKRGAIKPNESEIAANARARSAKLRYGIRSDAPARQHDAGIYGLPRLDTPEKYKMQER